MKILRDDGMRKFKDLKQEVYGDFLRWIENKKIPDMFHESVWQSKLFDVLVKAYDNDVRTLGNAQNILKNLPMESLHGEIKRREEELNKKQTELNKE